MSTLKLNAGADQLNVGPTVSPLDCGTATLGVVGSLLVVASPDSTSALPVVAIVEKLFMTKVMSALVFAVFATCMKSKKTQAR